jgi:aryl-alcohol dehydrogenase-like predicted oxidoreductase
MNFRKLGKTNFEISEIALGTWQVGGKWGSAFDNDNADKILNTAIDHGVNFIDTADVYSDKASEKAVGNFIKSRSERIYLATKCGRQINPHNNQGYTVTALRKFVEGSLSNTGLECLDLIQLHCPPTEVYYRPEIFGLFERLKEEGKILNLGVSVEKVEEGLKSIEFENVTTVQIIYNIFRQRPNTLFFKEAAKRNIGIIVRVPLASGLLSGKYTMETTFEKGDHRNDNRNGEQFDKGETFSGIPFDLGIKLVEKIKDRFKDRENTAALAIKWILMNDQVSCVIPGASRPSQVIENISASKINNFTNQEMEWLKDLYEQEVKPLIHHFW